jgi:phospholipid/cholesterol/gamma-HCH transport system ATP-binding protein
MRQEKAQVGGTVHEWTSGPDLCNQIWLVAGVVGGERSQSRGQDHVVFDDVSMSFGTRRVLRNLSCSFPRAKISVVLGGSGSGKTTILRLIGGLVRPRSGHVVVDGDDVTRMTERDLYKVRDKLGMVFQGGALLDSMTVYENVAFPLRERRHLPEEEIETRVRARLRSVGLHDAERLLPSEISGGMVKRVALARALIQDPVVVLIDEPFSGLDPVTVKLIEALFVKINRETHMTMIMSSHHIPTTMRMADKVVMLLQDAVIQGRPDELTRIRDARVRRFLTEEAEIGDVFERFEQYEVETAGSTQEA